MPLIVSIEYVWRLVIHPTYHKLYGTMHGIWYLTNLHNVAITGAAGV